MAYCMTMCICCFIIFLLNGITLQNNDNSADPCSTEKLLGHLPERRIGYKLGASELPISDYRLRPGWYSLPDNVTLATNAKGCGTYFNWWLKDSLPEKMGESVLKMCLNYWDECAEEKNITVQKCQNGFRYFLTPTDSDLEAYCIETFGNVADKTDDAPNISNLQPTITADVIKEGRYNLLEFYCDFTLPDQSFQNLLYDIEWSLHSGVSVLFTILLVDVAPYKTQEQFRNKTKLIEKDLKDNDIQTPGFTLSCSVRARKSILGRISPSVNSPPKFCGVKMLTPSVIRVEQDKEAYIELELTIPFGCLRPPCLLEFSMLVPGGEDDDQQSCELSRIARTKPVEGRNCGISFKKPGEKVTFKVAGKFGQNQKVPTSRVYHLAFSTKDKNLDHEFYGNYQLPSIRVEALVDQSPLQSIYCYSNGDPHMLTFNKEYYRNMEEGTFIMYRHKELAVEVQTKTYLCRGVNGVSCNSGIAIRAGLDIFLIDSDGEIIQPPRVVSCLDGVLDRQISKTRESLYEITFPHGTKVTVDIQAFSRISLNVKIFPSLVDINRTEGLCGVFLGEEDKVPRNAFIKKWRVKPSENLFIRTNHAKVSYPWAEELRFCECFHRSGFHNNTQCSAQRKCKVTGPDPKFPKEVKCDIVTNRRKRDAGGILFDAYTDPTTAFYSIVQTNDKSFKQTPRSKRKEPYTNVTARADCLKMMNTSVYQKCDQIHDLDIHGMVDNCVFDAVMTNSMEWTMGHFESIKQTCIEYVEVMQPLSQEARTKLVVLPDANSTDDVYNATYEYATLSPTTLPPSGIDPISPELLQDIKSNSCPNECQDHGKCENGTCTCDEPYTGFDCSIDITQPPIMLGIPDKGECDLQQRRCAKTAVFGRNFVETSNLSCRLKLFVVDQNNAIEYGQSVYVAGHFESMFEVYCRFPESRRTRSVPDEGPSDGELAYGYQASVSNDGKAFSEEDTIIIYDSQCVNCTKVQDTVVCINKSGNCWRQGRCYRPGETSETSECLLCSDEGGDNVQWSIVPNCIVDFKHEEPETMGAWKIGLIAAACAVILTVPFLVLLYFVKRKSAGKYSMKVTEIPLDGINQRQM